MKALKIASLALGIIAITVSWIPIVNNLTILLGGIAVILGIIYLFLDYRKKMDMQRGFVIAGIILGAISLVVMFATQTFYGSALEETVENTVSIEQAAENQEDLFSITNESFTEEYDTYVSGTLTNNASNDWEYVSVSYDFYDAEGVKLDSGYDSCDNLKAGESWKFKASYFGLEEQPASCVFSEITYW